MVAITNFSREHIFEAVQKMYTQVAQQPQQGFHFPSGRPACEFEGYPAEQLDAVPAPAVESFAGVGYPFACNVIQLGHTVLDIGAGAGTDALIASILTGSKGKVYGLDMTQAMHDKLHANMQKMGVENVEPLFGNAEEIPLQDGTIDVITSNGVLNLVPDKPKAFAEIHRVLKSGGKIQISDIVINKNSDDLLKSKDKPQLWAECIVGALFKENYIKGLEEAGFAQVKIHSQLDYFAKSSNKSTRDVAAYFEAESITLSGIKE